MRRNSILIGLTTIMLSLGTMGSECDPGIDDPDGGTGDDGGTSSCIEAGTCDPNKYADTDQGTYPTTNYPLLLLDTNNDNIVDTAGRTGGQIGLVNGWAEDSQIEYWLLSKVDAQNQLVDIFPQGATIVNRIYIIMDRDSGAKAGDSVVDTAPDASDYSPLLQAFHVLVPNGYVADTLKSEDSILAAAADDETGVSIEATNKVFVIQFVDASVGLAKSGGANDPQMQNAWFDGFVLSGYAIPGGNSDGTMPVANESDNPASVPPDPFLSELWQFGQTGGALCGGRNVYLDTFGGELYSPVPVRHAYNVPAGQCAQVPTNADAVITRISSGDYTQRGDDIVVVTPINP